MHSFHDERALFHSRHGHGPDHGPGAPGGRGPGGRHGRGGRGGDLARFFAHGDLRLVILHLIAEKPRHGYEIIKAIEERVAGAYSPSPGTVYPTLTLLEEMGLVTVSQGEGTKRLHTITSEGEAHLSANRHAVDAILARMEEAVAAKGDGPPPSLMRAKEGLKFALHMRLSRGPLDEDQAAAITKALEEATLAIERV